MPATLVQRGDEAELYRLHHDQLLRSVSRAVDASAALIEDACQNAWAILLRRQPDRGPALFGWLRTVAVHEAYRLSREERRELRLDVAGNEDDESLSPVQLVPDRGASVQDRLEARTALERVAQLPARQRRLFALQIAGLSYEETSALTGDTVRTIERQLGRAHATVRHAALVA